MSVPGPHGARALSHDVRTVERLAVAQDVAA
jgi:hypothetical protein